MFGSEFQCDFLQVGLIGSHIYRLIAKIAFTGQLLIGYFLNLIMQRFHWVLK